MRQWGMSIAPLTRPGLPATSRIALRPPAEAAALLLRDRPALHRLPPFDGMAMGEAEAFAGAVDDPADDVAAFALCELANGRVCGWASLVAIDRRHHHAAFGPAWGVDVGDGARIGCTAAHLLLRVAFEALGLVRVEAEVAAADRAARRLLDRLGFVREGIRRSGRCATNGRPYDVALLSVMAMHWRATAQMQAALLAELDSPWRDRLPSIMPP